MATTSLSQKFTQTYPATTLYWHTCQFTGERFCSPSRRVSYSPAGLKLKREHDEAIKAAAKHVCKVYFYLCPITSRWFTTRIPSSRYSPESKEITHQAGLDYAKQHRQRPETKERERLRNSKPERLKYRREWLQNKTKQGRI